MIHLSFNTRVRDEREANGGQSSINRDSVYENERLVLWLQGREMRDQPKTNSVLRDIERERDKG